MYQRLPTGEGYGAAFRRAARAAACLGIALGALSAACAPAYVQSEANEGCVHAASVVDRRESSGSLRSAVRALGACGDEGVRRLVQVWRRSELTGDDAYVLGGVSARFNDQRLFTAALAAVELEGGMPEFRAAAFRVLMSYAQPARIVSFPDRSAVLHGGDVGVGLQSESGPRGGRNDVSPAAAHPQVRSVLARRSKDDPDPWVRHIAGELEHLLDVPPPGR
jgi:hypothetical protein